MSCGPETPTFRLLDGYVGWDAVDWHGLEGLGEGEAVQLARLDTGALGPGDLDPWLPPPALARGCSPCEWYLLTTNGRLLRLYCSDEWQRTGDLTLLPGPRMVAASGHFLAISDGSQVWLLGRSGEQLLGVIDVAATAIAFSAGRELLVAVAGQKQLSRFDLVGTPLAPYPAELPAGKVVRMAVGAGCALFIVVDDGQGLHLYRSPRGAKFWPATAADLAAAFSPSGIAEGQGGFCLTENGSDGLPFTRCWDWNGVCAAPGAIQPAPPPPRQKQGQLLTGPIDSGRPRCRWHRVRIDADVPAGTRCWVDVASSENPTPPAQGVADAGWPSPPFPAALPHPEDWQVTHPADPLDFLIEQPPGRYLFLRLRFTGDGVATPSVRRIRVDLPRSTSLERLPPVFRDTPEAEDFTERFLSLFDATIAEIDQAILRAPALLDGGGVPQDVLPWLGAFLDIAFDASWTPAVRRRLLAAAPALYRLRGTRQGIIDTVRTITGVAPAILELGVGRAYGILGEDARLGGMRLFSRRKARFRLGSSGLGAAPLKSFGNPDQDPVSAAAFRFQVLVPPGGLGNAPNARERLAQLIASIKPAHTQASLRVGGGGFVLGISSSVGVDTVLGGLPQVVLGSARLSRNNVLAPGRSGRRIGFVVNGAAVGVTAAIR